MSKERLEEVNHIYEYIKRANDEEDSCNVEQSLNELFSKGFIDWLIKQAERVQELEEESYNAHLERLLDRKEQQNKRYREVIKKAIDDLESECFWDALVALKALEGDEELRI